MDTKPVSKNEKIPAIGNRNVMHKLKDKSYDKNNYNNFNVDSFRSPIKLWTKE